MRTKLLKAVPLLVAAVAGAAVMRLCSSAAPSGARSAAAAIEAPHPADVAPGGGSPSAVSTGSQPALIADHGRGDGPPCDPEDPRCTQVKQPLLVRIDQPAGAPAAPPVATATGSENAPGADITADLRRMSDPSDQIRLAAVQALSTSHDPRAVTALVIALTKDVESAIRREAALALGKVLDERTAYDVREAGLDALATAATTDSDLEVCVTADRVQQALAGLSRKTPRATATAR